MKKLAVAALMAVATLTTVVPDAEAARLGGGKSFGMQRNDTIVRREAAPAPQVPPRTAAAPAQSAPQAGAPAPQMPQKRSWLGPLAGLAAGIGLAALLSHFGLGEQAASFMLILLGVMAVMMLFRLLFRRGASQPTPQYAGMPSTPAPETRHAASAPIALPTSDAPVADTEALPSGFDADAFVREAKLNFIRLQAANDAGNLDDLREFTSPEMFAEIRLQYDERHGKPQRTDIVNLNAAVLDVATEGSRHVVSTRFYGMLREEDDAAPTAFDEVWHLVKPVDGSRGWMVAGIQQRH